MFQDSTTVPVSLSATDTADNAKYYHSKLHADWRDEQEPHFKLDFLPPYGPELNPIERVWKLTRRSCLHNQ